MWKFAALDKAGTILEDEDLIVLRESTRRRAEVNIFF